MENRGTIVGQLVEEPCVKTGTDYCRIVVASSYYTKASGKQTDFIPFFLRGQDALSAQKHLGKGAVVQVNYKLKYRKSEKDGETNYRLDTLVTEFKWYTKGRVSEKQYGITEATNTNTFENQEYQQNQQQYQQQNDTYENINYGVSEMSAEDSGDLGFM